MSLSLALLLPATPLLGLNLAGPADWNSELPFNDVFRMARPWISQREGAPWGQGPQLDLDERGWVRRLEPGAWAETPVFTDIQGHYPGGEYTLTYKGKGKIEFWGPATVVGESPGKIAVRLDPAQKNGVFIRLKATDPNDPVRDIQFWTPEGARTGARFSRAFLDRWKGIAAFRFMDWMMTNNSEVSTWAERPRMDDMTWSAKGIPVEVMVELANAQNADAWFTMPHRATNEYVSKFADYVSKNLKPNLKAYVEYSNEVWNGQFQQSQYSAAQGASLGLGNDWARNNWRYYSRRSREIFAMWNQKMPRSRTVRVLAAQAGWSEPAREILSYENAGSQADALAIAPYFGFTPSPESKPSAKEVAGWAPSQVLDKLKDVIATEVPKMTKEHEVLAKQYGLRLVAYEGGQHAVGILGGENEQGLTDLFNGVNRSPAMRDLYAEYLRAWTSSGGTLMMAFSSIGPYSKWGSWGALEYADEPTTPKYDALKTWAASLGQRIGP